MLRIGQIEVTATSDGKYTDGSVAGGIAATRLRAGAFNAIQEELAHIVELAGLALNVADNTQVYAALQKLFLSRANPFADIKADGNTAIAAALSNLGLGDGHGRLINIQVFTSSGTYTKTAGAVKGKALVQGGGGAGGGSAANSGSFISAGDGGDAGSYGETGLIDLTGVTTVPVTVGAGGTGSSAAAGTNGGSSSFGSYIVAPGGLGGAAGNSQAASSTLSNGHAATSACTGTSVAVNIPGSGAYSGEVVGSNRTAVKAGHGGDSQMGKGGNAQVAGYTSLPGTGYGSGGAGSAGAGSYSSSAAAGANGANGIVIVLEYA
jgi:hypothetical protein